MMQTFCGVNRVSLTSCVVAGGLLAATSGSFARVFSFIDNYNAIPGINGSAIELQVDLGATSLQFGLPEVGDAADGFSVGDFSPWGLNGIGQDLSGDATSLTLANSTNWGSIGHITYRFNAGADQIFNGNLDVLVQMGAIATHGGWGMVVVQYALDQNENWTDLNSVYAQKSVTDDIVTSGDLKTIDATGASDVYLRITMVNSYYSYAAQLSYLSVTGETVVIPESATLGLLGLGLLGLLLPKRA